MRRQVDPAAPDGCRLGRKIGCRTWQPSQPTPNGEVRRHRIGRRHPERTALHRGWSAVWYPAKSARVAAPNRAAPHRGWAYPPITYRISDVAVPDRAAFIEAFSRSTRGGSGPPSRRFDRAALHRGKVGVFDTSTWLPSPLLMGSPSSRHRKAARGGNADASPLLIGRSFHRGTADSGITYPGSPSSRHLARPAHRDP